LAFKFSFWGKNFFLYLTHLDGHEINGNCSTNCTEHEVYFCVITSNATLYNLVTLFRTLKQKPLPLERISFTSGELWFDLVHLNCLQMNFYQVITHFLRCLYWNDKVNTCGYILAMWNLLIIVWHYFWFILFISNWLKQFDWKQALC